MGGIILNYCICFSLTNLRAEIFRKMSPENLREMYEEEVQENFTLRSELNKKTMENKNLKYKCLIADEKIDQLQKENHRLKELMANMKQVNSEKRTAPPTEHSDAGIQ